MRSFHSFLTPAQLLTPYKNLIHLSMECSSLQVLTLPSLLSFALLLRHSVLPLLQCTLLSKNLTPHAPCSRADSPECRPRHTPFLSSSLMQAVASTLSFSLTQLVNSLTPYCFQPFHFSVISSPSDIMSLGISNTPELSYCLFIAGVGGC